VVGFPTFVRSRNQIDLFIPCDKVRTSFWSVRVTSGVEWETLVSLSALMSGLLIAAVIQLTMYLVTGLVSWMPSGVDSSVGILYADWNLFCIDYVSSILAFACL
jgi:hypothetical protein